MATTRVFFDCEFTGLRQDTTLISIGLVSEDWKKFYAEFTDYDPSQVDDWIRQNVLANILPEITSATEPMSHGPNQDRYVVGDKAYVANDLREWFTQFEYVEIWSDVLAYDWMLFCNLFGGPFKIPSNIYYIPFDLATLLKLKGIDPDVDRIEFSRSGYRKWKHHALADAITIAECHRKLMDW